MEKPLSNKNVYYLLIGAFSLFFFIELSYFLGFIFRDLLIISNQNPLLIFILNEGLEFFSFISFVIFGLRFLSRKSFTTKQIRSVTIFVIMSFVLTHVLEAFFRAFVDLEQTSLERFENYVSYLNKHYILYLIASLLSYSKYIIFALILFNYLRVNDFKTQS